MASPLAISLPPGYIKTDSALAAEGRYIDGDQVRFYRQRPQKVGGNVALIAASLGNPIRGMHTWNSGDSRQLLAAGTADKLYVIPNDTYQPLDITPPKLVAGFVDPTYGYGWGVGPWGKGTWGTPRPTSNILFEPRIWSLDNFGRILLAMPSDGALYAWDPSVSPEVPAAIVPGAPPVSRGFWQTAERFTLCFGCVGRLGEPVDLMRVSWCAQGDYTDWSTTLTPTQLANLPGASAGSRTLQFGQKIVGAVDIGNFYSLVWTDEALYAWQYVGSSYTFNSQLVGQRCGLLSRYGFAIVAGNAYWIANGNFWTYSGAGVVRIPNADDVSEWFFAQLVQLQSDKCFAYYNVRFSEVWFVIVPTGSKEPALAAVYNINENFWFHCTVERSAATAYSTLDPQPVLGGSDGVIYQHEAGLDDDGAALPWSLTTAYLEIDDGAESYDIFGMMPDMQRQIGEITALINALDRTPEPYIDTETETFSVTDGLVDFHLSGRQMQLQLSCAETGCDFRLGAPKIEYQNGGGRR